MRGVLVVFAIVGLVICIGGFATVRSDIQIIIGLVGGFSAVTLFGMASILARLEKLEGHGKGIPGRVRVTESEVSN